MYLQFFFVQFPTRVHTLTVLKPSARVQRTLILHRVDLFDIV